MCFGFLLLFSPTTLAANLNCTRRHLPFTYSIRYMVLLTFSTPRAAQLFAQRFGGKHYTTLDPARARVGYVSKATRVRG